MYTREHNYNYIIQRLLVFTWLQESEMLLLVPVPYCLWILVDWGINKQS
jgi:hypothetical protein